MSQRWRAVGNTVSDLTGPRFQPQTSSAENERVAAQSTVRLESRANLRFAGHYILSYAYNIFHFLINIFIAVQLAFQNKDLQLYYTSYTA